jgi:hypothetical protein
MNPEDGGEKQQPVLTPALRGGEGDVVAASFANRPAGLSESSSRVKTRAR